MWQTQRLGRLVCLAALQREEVCLSSGGPLAMTILSSKGFSARAAEPCSARLGSPGLSIKTSSREQSTWWRKVLVAEQPS